MIPTQPPQEKAVKIGSKGVRVTAPPPAAPVQMRAAPNIDDLLKDIKSSVLPPAGNGPPPTEKIKRGSGKPGSTGKNSVVIKL
jgi:hypothetical protein